MVVLCVEGRELVNVESHHRKLFNLSRKYTYQTHPGTIND